MEAPDMIGVEHERIAPSTATARAQRDGLGPTELRRLLDLVAMLHRARAQAIRPRSRLVARGA